MSDLLSEHAGAKQASPLIDVYPTVSEEETITVGHRFVNDRLGSEFTDENVAQILNNVEISSQVTTDGVVATVPFWRTDLEYREDLVEEIGRLHGYDNLPIEVPSRLSKPNFRTDNLRLKGRMRQILSAAGAHDIVTYNFVSSDLFAKAGYSQNLIDTAYRIRNSISPELEYMRISLLPSLADKVNANIRSGHSSFALYEINKSHNKEQVDEGLPIENMSLAMVVSSDREQTGSPYYQAKAYLDHLVGKLGLSVTYRTEGDGDLSTPLGRSVKSLFANERMAAVEINGRFAGFADSIGKQDSVQMIVFVLNDLR